MKKIAVVLLPLTLLTGCSPIHEDKKDEQLVIDVGNISEIEKMYLGKVNDNSLNSSENEFIYNKLANQYIKRNNYDSAFYYLSKTIGGVEHDLLLAKIKLKQGYVTDAVKITDKIKENDKLDKSELVEYYNIKGVLFSEIGDFNNSTKYLEKARALAGNEVYIRNNIAFSYIQQKKYEDAISILRPIVDTYPDYKVARDNLKLAYTLRDKYKEGE